MVDFKVNNGELISFIEKCACKGVVLITASDKISRNFFNYFYLDVKEGKQVEGLDDELGYIEVKAVDSEEKRMYIKHTLNEVEVEEHGVFAISDVNILLTILRSIPSGRKINFKLIEKGAVLKIETIDEGTYYGYNVRQTIPPEDVQIALSNSKHGVGAWDQAHSFEKGFPKFTIEEGSALYNTMIGFDKRELQKVIKDSISLTRDQDLRLSLFKHPKKKEAWIFQVDSGKKADNILSTTQYKRDGISQELEFYDQIVTNLHPIINHLFNTSTFFLRIAGDNSLKFWIQSSEGNIELNFCSAST